MNHKLNAKRVLVAMSGGVDSSVAAYLLQKEGYEVIGATMKLFCYEGMDERLKACCSLEAVSDAKSVCDKLGIPHYVISYEGEFEKEVIDDFVSEYERGRTPNPCIRCNQLIKFSYLLKKAKELGCDYVATGHYARITKIQDTRYKIQYQLSKGIDKNKDQTYFLYRLNREQLARLKFPLGSLTKKDVRKVAEEADLKTATKAESQEICFIEKDVASFLRGRIKAKKGDILDIDGKKVGEHEGVPFYTIGQRKGLGGGFETPMYVVGIDATKNTIIVGEEKYLYKKEVFFDEASWISGEAPLGERITSVVRYNMPEKDVVDVEKINGKYKAVFKSGVRAVAPGQAIVFYSGDECLGGGIITR